jgi:hypothetical protein
MQAAAASLHQQTEETERQLAPAASNDKKNSKKDSGEGAKVITLPTKEEEEPVKKAPVADGGEAAGTAVGAAQDTVAQQEADSKITGGEALLIGVYPGNGQNARSKEAAIGGGISFDTEVLYQPSYNLGTFFGNGVEQRLNLGLTPIVVVEFKGAGEGMGSLNAMVAGVYDGELIEFANNAKKWGDREIWIRPFHEFNGDWYPWSTALYGQNSDTFKQAYRHMVETIRGAGAYNVKFQLSYNIWSSTEEQWNWGSAFPGTDYVDMMCVSVYNRNCLENGQTWEQLDDLFRDWYNAMWSVDSTLPLCIAETSSNSCGGDKPSWIRNAFYDVADQFTRVKEINWFLEDKEGDWDLHSDAEKSAFRDGYFYARKQRG